MVPRTLMERVLSNVDRHVRASRGYEVESFINPLTPGDSVAAFPMASSLTAQKAFNVCVSVAPEGHVYSYFFQGFVDGFELFEAVGSSHVSFALLLKPWTIQGSLRSFSSSNHRSSFGTSSRNS